MAIQRAQSINPVYNNRGMTQNYFDERSLEPNSRSLPTFNKRSGESDEKTAEEFRNLLKAAVEKLERKN